MNLNLCFKSMQKQPNCKFETFTMYVITAAESSVKQDPFHSDRVNVCMPRNACTDYQSHDHTYQLVKIKKNQIKIMNCLKFGEKTEIYFLAILPNLSWKCIIQLNSDGANKQPHPVTYLQIQFAPDLMDACRGQGIQLLKTLHLGQDVRSKCQCGRARQDLCFQVIFLNCFVQLLC